MAVLIPTGLKTASYLMSKSPCLLGGILVITNGTNAATCVVYDDNKEATSGKVVWQNVDAAANNYGGGFFPAPLICYTGCYITISGTDAKFIAYELGSELRPQ